MADFHDLRTEGFATRSSGGSELLTKNSREELEGDDTVTNVNDVKKKDKSLRYRDQIYDKNTRATILVPAASGQKTSSKNKHSSLVIQVRRVYSERMVYVETKVDIKGRLLLEELKLIHGDTHGVFLGESSNTIKPELLFWSRKDIEERKEDLEKEEQDEKRLVTITELDVALRFIGEEYGELIAQTTQLLEEKKINFKNLWTIFAPNTLIYYRDSLDNDRISRLQSSQVLKDQNGSVFHVIEATHIDSDGVRLGIVKEMQKIPQFEGALSITELPVYPVEYHAHRRDLVRRLLERGETQLDFHGTSHHLREHDGYGLRKGTQSIVKFKTHGRLIVDAPTYQEMEPEDTMVPHVKEAMQPEPSEKLQKTVFGYVLSKKKEERGRTDGKPLSTTGLQPPIGLLPRSRSKHSLRSRRRSAWDSSDDDEYSSDEEVSKGRGFYQKDQMPDILKVMLSGRLYGFSLGDSIWGTFSVSRVKKFDWNKDVWKSLVMAPRQKDLLRRLVESHGENNSGFDDIISGKGKGLVGLLLGPPGVGKTLTAEAVAEISELPLFVMSCGGLGKDATEINNALRRYLELATRWRAVLLLDEADVYLAKRTENDLERNAIISVFLREIEYYTGIMILTTNRAQHIDPAFQSRIQFCHHYHNHKPAARMEIWKTFIDSSRGNAKVQVDVDEDGLNKLSALPLNGREIKNAMSLAVSLAASNPKDNWLRAEEIIDISTLLQNFNFVDEDELENKEEKEFDAQSCLDRQVDRAPPRVICDDQSYPEGRIDRAPLEMMCEVQSNASGSRPRKIGVRKIQVRKNLTEAMNTNGTNGVRPPTSQCP